MQKAHKETLRNKFKMFQIITLANFSVKKSGIHLFSRQYLRVFTAVSADRLRPTSEKDVLSMAAVVACVVAARAPSGRAAPNIIHCYPLPALHAAVCVPVSVPDCSSGVSQDFADGMC